MIDIVEEAVMSNNRELVERFYEEVMNMGNLKFIDEFFRPITSNTITMHPAQTARG